MEIKLERNVLVRNTGLNFLGQFIPIIVAIPCVPLIANSMGPERFGVLSLIWFLFASLSIFDLGMGRAMVKFVAEVLGTGKLASLPALVWSIIVLQFVLGIFVAVVGSIVLDYWSDTFLKVPADLGNEATAAVKILIFATPIFLIASSAGGVLEAYQRFDITNLIRSAWFSASFLLPLLGSTFELDLIGIVLLLVAAKFVSLAMLATAVFITIPQLRCVRIDLRVLRPILRFGGWLTLSNVISPILVNLDRYMLAFLLPISAIAYYSPASQAISYLSLVPASVTSTLFPAYSMLIGSGQYDRIQAIFTRSIKYTLTVLSPLVAIVLVFSDKLLAFWIGEQYAIQSSTALKILAVGVLINALAYSPATLLQATGRADIPAKFHLLELPIHACLTWVLIEYWGLNGAALAWSIRVSLDAIMLFVASFCIFENLRRSLMVRHLAMCASLVVALITASLNVNALTVVSDVIRVFLLCAILGAFVLAVWVIAIDKTDRDVMRNLFRTIGRQLHIEKTSAV